MSIYLVIWAVRIATQWLKHIAVYPRIFYPRAGFVPCVGNNCILLNSEFVIIQWTGSYSGKYTDLCSVGTCSETRPGYELFEHKFASACSSGYRHTTCTCDRLPRTSFPYLYTVHSYHHHWNRVMNKTSERQSPNHDTDYHFYSRCGFFVHGRQLFSTPVAWNHGMHEEIVFYSCLSYHFGGLVSFYFYCVIFVIVTLVWRILLLPDLF